MKTKKLSRLLTFCSLLFALCSLLFANTGCGKKKAPPARPSPTGVAKEPAPGIKVQPQPEETKKIVYAYRGDRFRDPFIPLEGEQISIQRVGEKLTTAELRALTVKGIIEDPVEKIALLTDTRGRSFVLKQGKLTTQEGKIVSGISGMIKKNKIILLTPETSIALELKEK